MSSKNKMEKQKQNILSISSKSKSVPSLLLSLSKKPSDNEKEISKNPMDISPNPYTRLKSIEEIINSKYDELTTIKKKLDKIKLKEKLIEKEKFETIKESLPFVKKQEIVEDNKIKDKLNIQNISLNNKLKLISEKVDKIESELIYGSRSGFLESLKSKLKEVLNQKEMLLLKIKENNNEIQKINEKDNNKKFKFNKKIFLENLDNINSNNTNNTNDNKNIENKNSKFESIKKYYLSENNRNYHKYLYEEEINKKLNDEKIKEKKYKEMREKEIKTVQKRKNMHRNFEKEMLSRNWINNLTNKKYYLSWEEKENQRKKAEEDFITLSNYQRNMMYKPLSSRELQEFSKKVNEDVIKNKNNSIQKKKMLEILWKERKDMLPKHKSKFLIFNIKNDKKIKEELILKKEKIKGNRHKRVHFSSDVCEKFKPKLIDEKIKNERIKKILKLDGKNKQREIQELNNKLKSKLIKIVNTQPQNFKKNNIFETSKSVFEQQILKLRSYKNLELSDDNRNNDKKNIFTPKNVKSKSINNSKNNVLEQLHSEKSYEQFLKDIQAKIRILNQFVE